MWWLIFKVLFIGLVSCDDCFSELENDEEPNSYPMETIFEWSHINFTWTSYQQYSKAIRERKYVPENVMPSGIKFYKDLMFIALPKFREGVPVTLTSLPIDTREKQNNLLKPYPSWATNDDSLCDGLQSVISMEIDSNGIMYVIDGVRMNNISIQCPCKVVLLDIKNHGEQIQHLVLPNNICLQNGGYLNDIVIDETDGNYAYITDTSNIDPGIVVFSRYHNCAWKIRDKTMFSPRPPESFIIAGDIFSQAIPVNGIALSPISHYRTLYYCALSSLDIFEINTNILKNKEMCLSEIWKYHVRHVGRKQSQSDGMMMDSKGNLFYTLIPLYGVGKWNMFESFETSRQIHRDNTTFIWTDSFGMDQKGNIHLMTNWAYKYFQTNYTLKFSTDIKFRIHRFYTGTKSYLFNDIAYFQEQSKFQYYLE